MGLSRTEQRYRPLDLSSKSMSAAHTQRAASRIHRAGSKGTSESRWRTLRAIAPHASRGHANILKRLLVHVCGLNLGLLVDALSRFWSFVPRSSTAGSYQIRRGPTLGTGLPTRLPHATGRWFCQPRPAGHASYPDWYCHEVPGIGHLTAMVLPRIMGISGRDISRRARRARGARRVRDALEWLCGQGDGKDDGRCGARVE